MPVERTKLDHTRRRVIVGGVRSQMITRKEAKRGVYREWRHWRKGPRNMSGTEMMAFFLWLDSHRPDLLSFDCPDGKWEKIRAWLRQFERRHSSA